jgi:ATP synthase protein I
MKNPNSNNNNSGFSSYFKAIRVAGPLFGSGIQLAASVVIMFFLGKWLDEKFSTKPWLMLVGVIFGLSAGFYNFIKIVNKIEKDKTNR